MNRREKDPIPLFETSEPELKALVDQAGNRTGAWLRPLQPLRPASGALRWAIAASGEVTAIKIPPETDRVVLASMDGTIRVLDLQTGRFLLAFKGPIAATGGPSKMAGYLPTPPRPSEPRLLGVREAATYLGSTVWAIRTLVWEEQIPHIKIGKRLLIDRADLDNFVDQHKILPRSVPLPSRRGNKPLPRP